MSTHLQQKRSAFTLIELLIVVAIIAILAAIAVPNFLEAQMRAKVSKARSDMRSLTTALESYYVDHNNYVPSCTNDRYNGYETNKGFTAALPLSDGYINQVDTATGGALDLTGSLSGGFFNMLSTPVAYIANSFIEDPFIPEKDTLEGYLRYNAFSKHRLISWEGHTSVETAGHSSNYGNVGHYRGDPGTNDDYNADVNPQIVWWMLWSVGPDMEDGGFVMRGYDQSPKDGVFERTELSYVDHYVVLPKLRANNEFIGWTVEAAQDNYTRMLAGLIYDPTNGSKSQGNLYRLGGSRPPEDPGFNYKYSRYASSRFFYEPLSNLTD